MPKMGYDMREGTVVRWYKREGEAVARGEVIADIETDKATVEFEAYTAGVLQRLVAVEGRPVAVGEAIAVIGEPGEIAAAAMPVAAVEMTAGAGAAGVAAAVVGDGDTAADDDGGVVDGDTAVAAAVRDEGEVRASPLARRLARERGIELATVAGSGPGGRIVEKDILEYATAVASGVSDGAVATVAATAPVGWVLASPLARRLARERGIELGLVVGSGPGGRVIERDVLGYVAAAVVPLVEDEVTVEVVPAADAGGPAAVAAGVSEVGVVGEAVVAAASGIGVVEEGVGTVAADVAGEGAAPAVGVEAVTAAAAGMETAAGDVAGTEGAVFGEMAADEVEEGMAAADGDRDGVAEGAAPAVAVEAVTAAGVAGTEGAAAPAVADVVAEVVETARDVAGREGEIAAAAVGVGTVADGVAEGTVTVERAALVGGPAGEVVAGGAGEGVEGRVGLSRMRQAIARVTGDSKRDAPHFYVTAEVDMGKAMALRREINDALPGEQRVSVNDLVVRACAMGLGIHPKFNAFFRGDHLQYNAAVNIGIAITLESGLIVPGISHCEGKSLVEIAAASKDLIARAQRGALRQEEYGDTTFSVSNLGMFEVDSFAAIIFPPHAAVLAVGTVREQPVVREGQLAVGQVMKATLSTDHRVADGAEAAQFLVEVKGLLENPVRLLL